MATHIRPHRSPGGPVSYGITTAREGHAQDLSRRRRQYLVTMSARVVLLPVAALLFDGWLRWAMVVLALLLPPVAVIVANAAGERRRGTATAVDRPQLTSGPDDSHAHAQ